MGYDIGYHAVDLDDIHDAFDFIFGKTDRISYLERAVTASRSRYIANSWGLGINRYSSQITAEAFKKAESVVKANTPGLVGRLFGKKAPEFRYPQIEKSKYLGSFDSNIHLWGRPFLIAQNDQLNQIIDNYLRANEEEAATIARGQIPLFKSNLLDKIAPDSEKIPDLETLRKNVEWKMEILRECIRSYPNEVIDKDGQTHSSTDLINSNLNFYVLENVSLASATWMDRGLVWPSHLLNEIGVEPSYFRSFSESYPLEDALPKKAKIRNETKIEENWMVGAMVLAEDLDTFQSDINNPEIIEKAKAENWDAHCKEALSKINECISYARHKNLCFIESSDIYSGPMGVIT